jgi:6-phosphogluconolactonase
MNRTMMIAVGTYGNPDSHNLRVLSVFGDAAEIEQAAAVSAGINPSYVLGSRDGKLLYVANERNRKQHGDGGTIRTYAVAHPGGSLSPVSEISSAGENPCFLAESPGGVFLVAVNYTGGTLAVFSKDRRGVPRQLVHKTRLVGFGPVRNRQDGSHPHGAVFSPDGRYLYVPDLGADRIWIFTMDLHGRLRAGVIPAVIMAPGSGPRSLAFDADRNAAFCLNELSSTIVQFRFDRETGMLHKHRTVSSLPDDYRGPNLAAELAVWNHTVVASNRGHNSLVFLHYDENGFHSDAVWLESGGSTPRSFCICSDPEGRTAYLAAANQGSHTVRLFGLTDSGFKVLRDLKIPSPACVRALPFSLPS